jgi:hypothetical protein
MSFAVVHMMKIGRGGLRGIQSHNQREKEPKTNPDIDSTRTPLNYYLLNNQTVNYNRAVSDRITRLATATQTVRKDAVVLCNFIVTSDSSFFVNLTPERQRAFFVDSVRFFSERYGSENLVSATVHMDETTPHMHLGLVPITSEKRLSAKTLFDKKELQSLQTDFARQVGGVYGLERGVQGSERTHLSEQRFKAAMAVKEAAKTLDGLNVLKAEKTALEGKIEAIMALRGAVVPVIEKKRGFGSNRHVVEVTMDKETYDACVAAQQGIGYAEIRAKQAEEKVARLERTAGAVENAKLQYFVNRLKIENNSLRERYVGSAYTIAMVEEVFRNNPSLEDAFWKKVPGQKQSLGQKKSLSNDGWDMER